MPQPRSVPLPGLEGRPVHKVVFDPDSDQVAVWANDEPVAVVTEGAVAQVRHLAASLSDPTRPAGLSLPAYADPEARFSLVYDSFEDHLVLYGTDGDTALAATDDAHPAVSFLVTDIPAAD